MKPHRLVIFAYHYPPENSVGGRRPFRFAKYLTRLGYHCHVITAADQTGREDPDTEYVPDPWVTRPRQGFGWQAERLIRRTLLPGVTGLQWSRQAVRAARIWLRSTGHAPATILSTFPPLGAHLAGRNLAAETGLPWLADFRDPLGDNPGDAKIHAYQQNIYRRLESGSIQMAGALIANTDAAGDRLRLQYPRATDRVHVIWNGFDPEERLTPLPLRATGHKLFSHVGELYQGRSITGLLESFQRLFDSGRLSSAVIHVLLAGPMQSDSIPSPAFVDRAKTSGWLAVVNEMAPQQQALELSRTSAGLLIVQPHSKIQVPGKLYEYLQIGRPVLAFIQRDTPIERILAGSGVPYRWEVSDASPDEIDNAVADFCGLQTEPTPPNAWFEQQFNAVNQTQALDRIVRSLHCG